MQMRQGKGRRWLAAAAVSLGLLLGGCDDAGETDSSAGNAGAGQTDAGALTVLGGSELKDLEPILADVASKTGVKLKIDYTGTLDGVARLQGGETPDLVWFSHAKYLELQGGMQGKILSSEKIMLSPVILGVRQSDAKKWGWDKGQVTWKEIAAKASSGELNYGMTNPAASNSGMTALIGVVAALSGKGDAITADDVKGDQLKAFFKGQKLTAGSSGWLAEAFVKDQAKLNGLINYESVLLSLNKGGQLKEPLTLIYPTDGLITADYPLMLTNEAQRPAYDKLVAALRSPEIQTRIMNETLRRPVTPEVKLSSTFPSGLLVELPFPASASVIDAILGGYLNDTRQPSNTIFVLDVSGSMKGDRIAALKTALDNLSGADTSLVGKFTSFADRERVTFIPFSGEVDGVQTMKVLKKSRAADLAKIQGATAALTPAGGTNIYGALSKAYQEAAAAPAGMYTSIVLMTDGQRTAGPSLDEFRNFYAGLPDKAKAVKTFTVLFGESDVEEMKEVATLTGGRTFDGKGNLAAAFKEIRGYQ